jgi:hypothetical protein
MRVAFDAVALLSPPTGIGQYALELGSRLKADPRHQARFFYAIGWSDEVRTDPLPAAIIAATVKHAMQKPCVHAGPRSVAIVSSPAFVSAFISGIAE